MTSYCPCGSDQSYDVCCEVLHLSGIHQPPDCTPERLMRSRYSAFVLGNIDYLLATLHPDYHQKDERVKIQHAMQRHQWRSLRVLAVSPVNKNQGQVEFTAFYTEHENSALPQQLHERSRFVFDQQRWLYTDGDQLPPIKLGRNDSCWCGSGKKLKKCHQG